MKHFTLILLVLLAACSPKPISPNQTKTYSDILIDDFNGSWKGEFGSKLTITKTSDNLAHVSYTTNSGKVFIDPNSIFVPFQFGINAYPEIQVNTEDQNLTFQYIISGPNQRDRLSLGLGEDFFK